MVKYLKLGISTLAVCAVFLAPAATVTVMTADAAYAKNGNGNGNGNGGGNRGGGNGAGKSGDKGDKGARAKGHNGNKGANGFKKSQGGSRSAKKGGFKNELKSFGNAFKKDVGALFGVKTKKKSNSQATRSAAAKVKGPLHPSNLGKLNGFINSSPNAKLAHIANGQYTKGTGPVSLAAALTVAKYDLGEEIDAYAAAYEIDPADVIDDAIETLHLDEAYDVLDDNPGVTREQAQAILDDDTIPDDDPRKEEAQDFVDAYDKVDVYEDGGGTREANEAKVADAEGIGDAGEAVTKAEEDALAHYKGDFDALSEEEQDDVRQALHDALPQDETEIHDALERYDEKSMSPDEGDEMDEEYSEGEDGEMTPEGSESAMSEEIVPNDQS